MATREYRAAPGTDVVDAAGNGWLIAGLEINNPSGSWLRVAGIEAYVPPYTMGWTMPLIPAQQTVTVRFVDSPSGTPSETVGGEIVVRVSDLPLPASQGFPSGAAQSGVPGVARVLTSAIAVPAREASAAQPELIVAAVPGRAIVPVRLYLSASTFITGVGFSFRELRSIVTVDIVNGALSTLLPHLSISPEMPTTSADFPIGTRVDEGDDISAAAYTQLGAGEQIIDVSIMYFYETVPV